MAADEGERGGLRNIWQAIGSLEANVARLLDGQSDLRSDLRVLFHLLGSSGGASGLIRLAQYSCSTSLSETNPRASP